MSDPKLRRFRSSDGQTALVPEDKIASFLERASKMGDEWTTDNAPDGNGLQAGMTVGAPEVIKTPRQPSQEESMLEAYLGKPMRGFAVGAARGLTGDFADNIGAFLGGDQVGQRMRDNSARAQQEAPMATGAGYAFGSMGPALLGFGAARAAGLVPQAISGVKGVAQAGALNAGLSAAQGGVARMGRADDASTMEALQAFIGDDSGSLGSDAAIGGALGAAPGAIAGVAGGAAGMLGRGADRARQAALGGTKGQYKQLLEKEGLESVQGGLGQDVEALGLTNRWAPQNASDYLTRIQGAQKEVGQRIGGAVDEATASGALAEVDPIREALQARAQQAQGGPSFANQPADPALANQLGRVAADVPQETFATPAQLMQRKVQHGQMGYPEGLMTASDAPAAQAQQVASQAYRDPLHALMQEQPPNVQNAFFGGNRDFSKLKAMEPLATDAAAAQNAPMSPWSSMPIRIAGGAMGAGAGYASGGMAGGMVGAMAGEMAMGKAQQLARQYGPDLAANLLRRGEEGLSGFSEGAGAVARATGGQGSTALSSGITGANEGRGYLLPQAVQHAVQNQPEILGKYHAQFAAAIGGGGSGNITTLIQKLEAEDEEFRTQVLPRLRELTRE